jgi:hypothetical protein
MMDMFQFYMDMFGSIGAILQDGYKRMNFS